MQRRDSFVWLLKACLLGWSEELEVVDDSDFPQGVKDFRRLELGTLIEVTKNFLEVIFDEDFDDSLEEDSRR